MEHRTSSGGTAGPRSGRAMLSGLPHADGFRRHLTRRPPLSPPGVLSAVGGTLLGAAAYGILAIPDDASPWLALLIGSLLVALGWLVALGLWLAEDRSGSRRFSELVPAATVVAVVGVYLAAIGLALAPTEGSTPSGATAWWPAVAATAVLVLLWFLPGLQGRPTVLAAALVTGTYAAAAAMAVAVGFDRAVEPAFGTGSLADSFDPFGPLGPFGSDGVKAGATVALAVGGGFLVLAAVVDRMELPGLGTPLIVAGVVTGLLGSFLLAPDNDLLRASTPIVVVALLGAVGVHGGRRASVWLAGVLAVPLLVQLLFALLGDDPSPSLVVLLLFLVAVLVLIAAAVALTLGGRGPGGPTAPLSTWTAPPPVPPPAPPMGGAPRYPPPGTGPGTGAY